MAKIFTFCFLNFKTTVLYIDYCCKFGRNAIFNLILYNYPLKGRWIVVDIYRDGKGRGIYPLLFTNPEGDSCFSIYQIRWRKEGRFINGHNFFFWNFRETMHHFSLRSQNSANQNEWKLLSTDLVLKLHIISDISAFQVRAMRRRE